ncbi:MAG: helix-turn-helix transcriptional regulator [Planctomycetes bacterium]|nr:helix-turn-helix transcriptional regulator [Planctomycetota bacterium]
MSNEQKPTSSAAEIMHRRYIKGEKKRLKYIEKERERVEIAQKIYELRIQVGLTQQELAKRVGTRQSVISRLESADYSGHTQKMLQKIAHAVHCYVSIEFVPQNKQFAYV